MFYNNAWTFCNFIENKLTTLQQSNIKQSMSKYLFQLKLIILLRQIRIIVYNICVWVFIFMFIFFGGGGLRGGWGWRIDKDYVWHD